MTDRLKIRLHVYLARAGIGSRRNCEILIKEGRVRVNNQVILEMGYKVFPGDSIRLDGKRVNLNPKKIYVALHKPRGYICSNSDPQCRPLAGDLFKSVIKTRLFHAGRLDFNSSGLIIYTNDGDLAKIITHPRYRIEKEYLVETSREIEIEKLDQYCKGITIEGIIYRLLKYEIINPKKAALVLLEGKNREIRRVFSHFHIYVKGIRRLRIGIVKLKGIPAGGFRMLNSKEVSWFLNKHHKTGFTL